MVIKFKGHWKWRKCNPNKLAKYCINTYGICDSITGYACNILTYFGASTSYNPNMTEVGMSEKLCEYLLSPLGTGLHAFADRFHATHSLLQYLTNTKAF